MHLFAGGERSQEKLHFPWQTVNRGSSLARDGSAVLNTGPIIDMGEDIHWRLLAPPGEAEVYNQHHGGNRDANADLDNHEPHRKHNSYSSKVCWVNSVVRIPAQYR